MTPRRGKTKPTRKPPAKPSVRTELLRLISVEGLAVKDATAKLGIAANAPSEWARHDEAFSALYARAREEQAHRYAEQAIRIADGTDALCLATKEAIDDEEARLLATNPKKAAEIIASLRFGALQRDRMRFDARRWYTSKIAPKLYGERTEVEHGGKVAHQLTVEYTDEDE